MRLLKRETEAQSDPAAPEAAAPEAGAPEAAAPEAAAPEAARACPACHAPLEPEQDWCLRCGSAQSRLGGRMPGMRAAGTVVALTAVLVGGAVAAAYAALQDGPAPAPASSTQLAQAPQPAPPAPAPSTPTPSPQDAPPTTPPTVENPLPGDTPKPPKSSDTPTTPSAASNDTSTTDTSDGGSSDGSSTGGSSNDTTTSTTPDDAATELEPLELDDGAGALYDPYTRDTAAGDAAKAFDDNITTSFPITVADGSEQVGAGLAVDLGKKRAIRRIDLKLKTPGVGLEVYATDEADLPPDVLDSRWAHLRSLDSAGSAVDGHQTIKLGKGTTKYRHVLLWFTTPPKSGTTVRVTELQLLA